MNPRDNDLNIEPDGDNIVFNVGLSSFQLPELSADFLLPKGFKNFNTGGVISDLTVLEGAYQGTSAHIFALAPTQQTGIQFAVGKTFG